MNHDFTLAKSVLDTLWLLFKVVAAFYLIVFLGILGLAATQDGN